MIDSMKLECKGDICDLLNKAMLLCAKYIAENGTDNLDMIELEDGLDELMNTYC